MGSIVPFVPRSAGARQAPRTADSSASIVIFPGVRYERTTASTAAAGERLARRNVSRRKETGCQGVEDDRDTGASAY
ncbi:hypothetical protein [Mesorhizobium sp. ANAO-SY3R2]|uniref:hypothetical protein n=1 Tax=Mesorhizobium sp. ANAO-SY3R2 TaxID=3166644 RepID=UPI00366B5C36